MYLNIYTYIYLGEVFIETANFCCKQDMYTVWVNKSIAEEECAKSRMCLIFFEQFGSFYYCSYGSSMKTKECGVSVLYYKGTL